MNFLKMFVKKGGVFDAFLRIILGKIVPDEDAQCLFFNLYGTKKEKYGASNTTKN